MEGEPLTIAMVAGEASGDRQGAALLAALRERAAPRPVKAWGIGGDLMRAEGVALRYHSGPWASIGIAAVAAHLPYLLSVRADMKRALAKDPPDALVLIDSGGFNVPLGRWIKERRICPVFYYFPPGSWRRKPRAPGRKSKKSNLAGAADRIVSPFAWNAEFLRAEGADAHFVGHPLLDVVRPVLEDAAFYERYGLDPQRPLVALLPGSRRMEIRAILPALIGAAGEISRRIPGVQFALVLAPTVPRGLVEKMIRREQRMDGRAARLHLLVTQAGGRLAHIAQTTLTPPMPRLVTSEGMIVRPPVPEEETTPGRARPAHSAIPSEAPLVICEGIPYDVMARSDLVITKSGTSTLEAAILQKPMIIVYRVSALMALEWRLRRRSVNIQHFGLPNILAGERIIPELLQDEASPEAIADLAVGMLLQPERLLALKERLAQVVRNTLGENGGVRRAAALLYETATADEVPDL